MLLLFLFYVTTFHYVGLYSLINLVYGRETCRDKKAINNELEYYPHHAGCSISSGSDLGCKRADTLTHGGEFARSSSTARPTASAVLVGFVGGPGGRVRSGEGGAAYSLARFIPTYSALFLEF